jgi:iron complex outermembrane receptor protein
VVPLLKDSKLGKSLDFDGAVRETHYSTSGNVTTWKLSGIYSPVDDFKLRVTRSRDIRAGSLSILYQPGQTLTSALFNPWTGNIQNIQYSTVGNPTISPEQADTLDIGGVFRPRWIRGLSFSVDYWNINLKDAITTIGATDLINGCYNGQFPQFCQYVIRDGSNNITTVIQVPVNIAFQHVRGIDMEVSYRRAVGKGDLTLRALATRGLESTQNSGLTGAATSNSLGTNSTGSLPYWRYTLSATYAQGPFTGELTARGFSSGVYSNAYVQCTSSCPANTAANPTISNNHLAGALYFDLSLNYKIMHGLEGFVVVTDLANAKPAAYPNGPSATGQSWGVNWWSSDVVGRMFRAGVRFSY